MTAPSPTGRALRPSLARQLAQFIALSDDCGFVEHNAIAAPPWPVCPRCGLDIGVYVDALEGVRLPT